MSAPAEIAAGGLDALEAAALARWPWIEHVYVYTGDGWTHRPVHGRTMGERQALPAAMLAQARVEAADAIGHLFAHAIECATCEPGGARCRDGRAYEHQADRALDDVARLEGS